MGKTDFAMQQARTDMYTACLADAKAAKAPNPEALASCCVHISNGSGYGQEIHEILDRIMVTVRRPDTLARRLGGKKSPVPPPWCYVYSASKKKYYYFNKTTQESNWGLPRNETTPNAAATGPNGRIGNANTLERVRGPRGKTTTRAKNTHGRATHSTDKSQVAVGTDVGSVSKTSVKKRKKKKKKKNPVKKRK